MEQQLDVVVVSRVARDLREWLRTKAFMERRTMSSIVRDMLAEARRQEHKSTAADQREALDIERSRKA